MSYALNSLKRVSLIVPTFVTFNLANYDSTKIKDEVTKGSCNAKNSLLLAFLRLVFNVLDNYKLEKGHSTCFPQLKTGGFYCWCESFSTLKEAPGATLFEKQTPFKWEF